MESTHSTDNNAVLPCMNLSLRKANRVLSQIYDHHLADCGIKASQFSILRAIHYLGDTTNKTLQEVLVLDQTTLSRNLKPLVRDGFVRTRPGVDRRERRLSLSTEGQRLYRQAEQYWREAQTQVMDRLGPEQTRQLVALSEAVVSLKS